MTTTPPHELFQMLRGKTIRDLNEWPEQLHKSSEGVGHKLAELAKDEYRSLISIDGFCRQVEDSLCQLTGLADQLSSSVTQKLRNAGDKFALITTGAPDGGLISQIAGCRQILKTYGKLSALLEVHRVMDGLIRGGHYEDAMELQQYINRLRIRFPKLALLRRISERMNENSRHMVSKLISELQGNSELHNSIRIIGYLRRSQVFTEDELRLVFLNGRYQYFRRQMESSINNHTSAAVARMDSDGQESLAFAKSLLDCARALFLDVFTQYQAIFSNSNLPSTTALAEDYSPPASILFSFMTHLSEEFLCDFTKSIDDIFDIGSLSNLLTQAMHFGVAISRKGIDIRYQLTAIIRDRVIKVVAEHSERATVNFMTEFEQNGFKTMISARSSKQQHTKTNFSVEGADKRSPDALLDYPPLAALLNSNLQLFNMFRIIPVVELSFELGKIFMRNTLRIIEAFSNYYRQNIAMNSSTTTANSEQERTDQERAFRELFRAFADLYIPFICRFMNDGLHLPNHQTISKELQLATQAIII